MLDEIFKLRQKAKILRRTIIEMAYQSEKKVHVGAALSCIDIITALYFKYMRVDPKNPTWEDRDRFVLSKGHAYLSLYAALYERGFFAKDELKTVRHINSYLQGHPTLGENTGS